MNVQQASKWAAADADDRHFHHKVFLLKPSSLICALWQLCPWGLFNHELSTQKTSIKASKLAQSDIKS